MSLFSFLRKTFLYILAIPLLFIVLGAASNQAVMIANHNTFPVQINLVKMYEWTNKGQTVVVVPPVPGVAPGAVMIDDTHCLMTDKTHLNFMADVFDFHNSIESIGDLSIDLGEWLWMPAPFVWAFAVMKKLNQ